MGWKNVKEHYRIVHAVQVRSEGICIGSPYVSDIIVISLDGVITKRPERDYNADISRYIQEFAADPSKLKQLILIPDLFTASIPVYTYDGGDIIEKLCETPGWPNVTHDGLMMYENTFSTDRAKVVESAKRNARAGIELWGKRIEELKQDIAKTEKNLAQDVADLAKLEAEFQ